MEYGQVGDEEIHLPRNPSDPRDHLLVDGSGYVSIQFRPPRSVSGVFFWGTHFTPLEDSGRCISQIGSSAQQEVNITNEGHSDLCLKPSNNIL